VIPGPLELTPASGRRRKCTPHLVEPDALDAEPSVNREVASGDCNWLDTSSGTIA